MVKEDIEAEILKEAQAEAKTEEKMAEKPSKLKKAADAVKKDISKKPEKEKQKTVPKAKAKSKKKGGLMDRAMETLDEARVAKNAEPKDVKPTRLKGKDRLYTIPLRTTTPRRRRARWATAAVKDFARKHTKAENIVITKEVNEKIWEHGRKKAPAKLRVVIGEDEDGRAVVRLK